jgi:hypothetical protein
LTGGNNGTKDVQQLQKAKAALANDPNKLYENWEPLNVEAMAGKLPLLGTNWKGIEIINDKGEFEYQDDVNTYYLQELFKNRANGVNASGQLGGANIYSTKSPDYVTVDNLSETNKYEAFLVGGQQTVKKFFGEPTETDADFGVGQPGSDAPLSGKVISRDVNANLTIDGINAKDDLANSGSQTVCAQLQGLEGCDGLKDMAPNEGELLHEQQPDAVKALTEAKTDAVTQVAKLNPEVAFGLLKRAGCEAQRKWDSAAGRNLLKVEPVDEWCERVGINKDKLANYIAYLRLVVAFVDQNPAILNEDYRTGPVANPASGDPFGLALPLGKKRRETNMDDFRDQISRRNRYIETMVNGL